MIKDTVEKLKYLEVKRKYNRFLRANKQENVLSEYAQTGLFKAFADPFKDIFKSLKLSAMDISNALQLVVKTAFYVRDPQKLTDVREEYDLKKAKILKEWEPIMERSMKAVKTADPFLTMMLAPQVFLASKTLTAGVAAGKTAAEIIAAEDWASIRSKINRMPDEKTGLGAIYDQQKKSSARQENVLMSLYSLFHGQPQATNEGILREQEEGKAPTDPVKWLDLFFTETGISDEFTDAAAELLQGKLVLAKEAAEQLGQNVAVMKLIAAQGFENFKSVLADVVSSSKMSPDSIGPFREMIPALEEQAAKMAASKEFANKVAEATKKPVEEITEDELKKNALDFVFKESKKKFDEKNSKMLKPFVSELEKMADEVNLDDKTLTLVRGRKDDLFSAEEFLKIYDEYEKLYKEFKDLSGKIKF